MLAQAETSSAPETGRVSRLIAELPLQRSRGAIEQAAADATLALKHDTAARESVVRALLPRAIGGVKCYFRPPSAVDPLLHPPPPVGALFPEIPLTTRPGQGTESIEMRGSVFVATLCLVLTATADGMSSKKKRKKVGTIPPFSVPFQHSTLS